MVHHQRRVIVIDPVAIEIRVGTVATESPARFREEGWVAISQRVGARPVFFFAGHVSGAGRVDGSACGDVGEFKDAAGCDEGAVEESGEGWAGVNLDGRLDKGLNGVEEVFEGMGVDGRAAYDLVAAVFYDLLALWVG